MLLCGAIAYIVKPLLGFVPIICFRTSESTPSAAIRYFEFIAISPSFVLTIASIPSVVVRTFFPPLAAGEPVAIGQMSGIAANDDLEIATPAATTTDNDRISDLSPMIEQQIQETLEKVAWEAFSDLSETIVKQVISRVEKIAWEVIPQMAETLVREEIRKMKGEND